MKRFLLAALASVMAVSGFAIAPSALEAGGGGHGGCTDRPREATNETVFIERNCFNAAVLHVAEGDTVTWTSRDQVPHNVTFLDGSRAGEDSEFSVGESVSQAFPATGLYAYYCSIHPSMLGVVAVGDPANFAVASEPAPPPAEVAPATPTTASSDSSLTPALGGLILSVGLVSAGGGYLLRRRKA